MRARRRPSRRLVGALGIPPRLVASLLNPNANERADPVTSLCPPLPRQTQLDTGRERGGRGRAGSSRVGSVASRKATLRSIAQPALAPSGGAGGGWERVCGCAGPSTPCFGTVNFPHEVGPSNVKLTVQVTHLRKRSGADAVRCGPGRGWRAREGGRTPRAVGEGGAKGMGGSRQRAGWLWVVQVLNL